MQGVGFRYFVKQHADRLGIVGFVRNLPNGEVEIDATGDQDTLNEFAAKVSIGPSAARVQHIHEQVIPVQNMAESFTITHF